jgi:hypothetical protein
MQLAHLLLMLLTMQLAHLLLMLLTKTADPSAIKVTN